VTISELRSANQLFIVPIAIGRGLPWLETSLAMTG
jgi:hypothetical protein